MKNYNNKVLQYYMKFKYGIQKQVLKNLYKYVSPQKITSI